MSTMDLAEFNRLLKTPNYHPLYSRLESMTVDELITFLHNAGFKCGTAQDFKRVILWAVSDELTEKKQAALNPQKVRIITPVRFAYFIKRIYGHFMAIESRETFDTASARKVNYLIAKLEELRKLDRHAGQTYVSEAIVTAVELRMHRWYWKFQSQDESRHTLRQAINRKSSTSVSDSKPAPHLIPILNAIVRDAQKDAQYGVGVRTSN